MEPIPQINNSNAIANIKNNANGIPKVGINGPSVISTIEQPVLRNVEVPVVRGMVLPIVDVPDTSIKYPVINVPTQEEFNAAVRAEQKKQQEQKEEKPRSLPESTPQIQLPQVAQTPEDDQQNSNHNNNQTNNLGVPIIEVPIIGEVPIPPKEQVILAGTTATASVAAALIGKSLVEWMVKKMKPIVEQIFVRGKKLLNKDLTPYETQVYFAFEKSASTKKINKLLKKEQQKNKQDQYKKFHSN
jgi:hypothetical protein